MKELSNGQIVFRILGVLVFIIVVMGVAEVALPKNINLSPRTSLSDGSPLETSEACYQVWDALYTQINIVFGGVGGFDSRSECHDYLHNWVNNACENACPQGMSWFECSVCCSDILNQFGDECYDLYPYTLPRKVIIPN